MSNFVSSIPDLTTRQKERLYGYLLIIPGLLGLAIFVVYPMLSGIGLSFQRRYLLEPSSDAWIALENFRKFLFENEDLGLYVGNTLIWTVGSVIGRIGFGLVLALLLNRDMPYRGIYRALALIPWVMPMVVAAVVWQWIFNANWGIFNHILRSLGLIERNIAWVTNPRVVWPAILLVSIWKGYPFSYAFLLAGLQTIPEDLYEAARIDGANRWGIFWHIILPYLRPQLFVIVLLQTVWVANDFTAIWTLTRGGPGDATMTLAPLVYRTSFQNYRMGYGASIAVLLMLVMMTFAVVYIKNVRAEL